ncbi:conjugative pilus assembly domain protein [Orientia tsutsugamushi str. Gilliam]|uniref:Conjugative pilus assembly domain protein n=1 Tax=Orientia tsutsugamushi str. Gilliam TaxID=1359184 RepID=A0A0F3M8S5_ORITS|nr:hypothetical protein [Orientia tsutsugamushi]KJV52120.1 conjugative pilus assembly domain protein [Orientia tsutsugamushi str. Gilliam]
MANSPSSQEPIVLQLVDTAILYDEYKTDQIKKVILKSNYFDIFVEVMFFKLKN